MRWQRSSGSVRRHPSGSTSRLERAARARRKRALHRLDLVRNAPEGAGPPPPPRLLVFALLLAAVAGGLVIGTQQILAAPLQRVTLHGLQRLGSAEVLAASGLAPGAPLAGIDPARLTERLRAHPWIADARALRLPRGHLVLEIRERRAVARLDGEQDWAIDAEGRAFAPLAADAGRDLLALVAAPGLDAAQAAASLVEALALGAQVDGHELPALREIRIRGEGDPLGLELRLEGIAPWIVVGRGELGEKLTRLEQLLAADLPELAQATRLDLRFGRQAVLDVPQSPEGTAAAARPEGIGVASNEKWAG